MDLKLTNKKVLVTGSSRGLGYAMAAQFALEGALVCINGRNSESLDKAKQELENQTQKKIHAISGDVSDPETPSKLVRSVAQTREDWISWLRIPRDPSPACSKISARQIGKTPRTWFYSAIYA